MKSLYFKNNPAVDNVYYDKFHNLYDNILQEIESQNDIKENLNIKYYNCNIEFSFNNQLHKYLQ